MIVEHLQMMSIALAHYGYPPAKKKDSTYYSTRAYKNHPCTLWVKESSGNFMSLFVLTRHLCSEFTKRFNKTHSSEKSLTDLVRDGVVDKLLSESKYPHIGYTPPALCMPEEFKDYSDPVGSYRRFYNYDKWEFASWDRSPTGVPSWWAPACVINDKKYEKILYYW